MVGQCRSGRFDTPDLNAIKMNIQIKERGKRTMLGSWKDVVDNYGEAVAKASLRQGTLPNVPHPFLLPGHGVRWPDSHQFMMEESWWSLSWREKLNFESAGEQEATQAQIEQWLRESAPSGSEKAWKLFGPGPRPRQASLDLTLWPLQRLQQACREKEFAPNFTGLNMTS